MMDPLSPVMHVWQPGATFSHLVQGVPTKSGRQTHCASLVAVAATATSSVSVLQTRVLRQTRSVVAVGAVSSYSRGASQTRSCVQVRSVVFVGGMRSKCVVALHREYGWHTRSLVLVGAMVSKLLLQICVG
jgi:hypothetical protein